MRDYMQFYINGEWVDPATPRSLDVIDPATEEVAGHISLGSDADIDNAVNAAANAFKTWSSNQQGRAPGDIKPRRRGIRKTRSRTG